MKEGEQAWITIGKNNIQICSPDIDANGIVQLIKELRHLLDEMLKE